VPGLEELSREELIGFLRRSLARVAELEQANAELTERVARLERLVSRNSRNSSMPPSKDDDPGRTPPAEPPATGDDSTPRKRGKRKGAPGSRLSWSAQPDDTREYFPAGACGCGSDLVRARDLGVVASHQQVDIPLVAATVIQHDRVGAEYRIHAAQKAWRSHRRSWRSDPVHRRRQRLQTTEPGCVPG
jgi:hypothetical protein